MDRNLWYKIFRSNAIVSEKTAIGKFSEDPMNYKTAKDWAMRNRDLKDVKITYGTRTKKFYVIDQSDRDWERFSVFPKEFVKFKNEKDAINTLVSPRRF